VFSSLLESRSCGGGAQETEHDERGGGGGGGVDVSYSSIHFHCTLEESG